MVLFPTTPLGRSPLATTVPIAFGLFLLFKTKRLSFELTPIVTYYFKRKSKLISQNLFIVQYNELKSVRADRSSSTAGRRCHSTTE